MHQQEAASFPPAPCDDARLTRQPHAWAEPRRDLGRASCSLLGSSIMPHCNPASLVGGVEALLRAAGVLDAEQADEVLSLRAEMRARR